MNIVFYSTYPVKQLNNSLITASKKLTQFPSCQNEFLEFCKKYPEHNFYCIKICRRGLKLSKFSADALVALTFVIKLGIKNNRDIITET